jgi:hypothetical protein
MLARTIRCGSLTPLSMNWTFQRRGLSGSRRRRNIEVIEHVFGDQKNGMGAGIVRTIGIVRAQCKIGMTNLVYNMRRFACLERIVAAAA